MDLNLVDIVINGQNLLEGIYCARILVATLEEAGKMWWGAIGYAAHTSLAYESCFIHC